MYGSAMIGLGALLAPLGASLTKIPEWVLFAGQVGTASGLSAGTMMLNDISDGYVDRSWQEYLLNFGASRQLQQLVLVLDWGQKFSHRN